MALGLGASQTGVVMDGNTALVIIGVASTAAIVLIVWLSNR